MIKYEEKAHCMAIFQPHGLLLMERRDAVDGVGAASGQGESLESPEVVVSTVELSL
jgi:hypothetical protein